MDKKKSYGMRCAGAAISACGLLLVAALASCDTPPAEDNGLCDGDWDRGAGRILSLQAPETDEEPEPEALPECVVAQLVAPAAFAPG